MAVIMPRISVPVRVYTPPPAPRVAPPAARTTTVSRPAAVQEAPQTNMTPVIVTGALLTGAALTYSNGAKAVEETPMSKPVETTELPNVVVKEPAAEKGNADLSAVLLVLALIVAYMVGSTVIRKIPSRSKRQFLYAILMLICASIALSYFFMPK